MGIIGQYVLLVVLLAGVGLLWVNISETSEAKARSKKVATLLMVVGVLAYTAQYFTMG